MRFLVDAQLPPSLTRWFGDRGIAASSVKDVGLRDSDDGSIWRFATQGMWVVITKDEDFVARCIGDPAAPPVVWLRIGNCTNRVLFSWLDPILPEIAARLNAGEKLLEIR
jgi:predicted nuclease of predicted toxin-antitoxin system